MAKKLSVRSKRRAAFMATQDAGVVKAAKLASVASLVTKAGSLYDAGDVASAETLISLAVSAGTAMNVKTDAATLRKIAKTA